MLTNSSWVAVLTFGEGWHNNHHPSPQSACHGFALYELDLNWYGIVVLRMLGLAWDIKLPRSKPVREARVLIPAELAEGKSLLPTLSSDR